MAGRTASCVLVKGTGREDVDGSCCNSSSQGIAPEVRIVIWLPCSHCLLGHEGKVPPRVGQSPFTPCPVALWARRAL